ncbi:MAG TPA: GNAT family N-acetyltransferase [Streptosporangiaceae bacterium]|jgi:ribosomal protein S18 acetylase RimI-like enzyme|nr:GNAT family N-acetyltransferase [Streptosporangiaceae bacterium]
MDPEIAAFERTATLHWQGIDQEWLGGWLLRAAGGFTGRANSVLPAGDPGRPADQAIAEVTAWYAARGLGPLIAVHDRPGDPPGPLETRLAERGWTMRYGPALVMTAHTATIAALPQRHEVGFAGEPDEQWLALYRYGGSPLPAVAVDVLMSAPVQTFASVRRDGRTIATGRLSLAGGWAGITAVEVHPDWRRAGLATSVTATLAARATEYGVGRVFLQVTGNNTAAHALYTRCGFLPQHRYHYRLAPAPAAAPAPAPAPAPRS